MLSKKEPPVQLSARNQLKGTVRGVKLGTVMAEVVMDVGGQTLTAAITRVSAENLDLKPGDQVTAVIKATEVIVGK
jgi:molybdate transport system regulatory protein